MAGEESPHVSMDRADHRPRAHWRSNLAACIATLLAILVIGLVWQQGRQRGMDHVAAFGPESEQTAIAIALSEMVYGLDLGYVGFASVRDRLVATWNEGAKSPHDPILYENNRNRDLINRAIRSAATMGPQQVGYLDERSLITTVYDDIGYVDYVKLSFRLFGLSIESTYHTFFVLLLVSAFAFIVTFRRDPAALVVLLLSLFAFLIEMNTSIFTPDMPTFAGMRHSSTLALIPAWHFAFLVRRDQPFRLLVVRPWRLSLLLLRRQGPAIVNVLMALVQLFILALAVKIRGSASWCILFVLGFRMLLTLISDWGTAGKAQLLRAMFVSLYRWPIVLLVGGMAIQSVYVRAQLHPIYFTDDVIPYHGLWHSAVIGFSYTPELIPSWSRDVLWKDVAGYQAAKEYLAKSHFMRPPAARGDLPPTYLSPWTGTLKFRLHDEIMRRVFFDAVASHPLTILRLYLVEKPLDIYRVISLIFYRTESRLWMMLLGMSGLAAGIFLLAFDEAAPKTSRPSLLLGLATALPFAALPNLWAYAAFHTVSDVFLVLLLVLQFVLALCVVRLLRPLVAVALRPFRRDGVHRDVSDLRRVP